MSCQRFDTEILPALESGAELAHLASCETCQGRLAEIEGVKSMLAAVPVLDAGDWESRIWARVAAEPPRRRWGLFLALGLTGAGAATVALWVARPIATGAESLDWAIIAGATSSLRGNAAHPGDRVVVHTSPEADLRLFREGRLQMRCGDGPMCQRSAERLTAEMTLMAPGRYRIVSVGGTPLDPSLDLDATLGTARTAGSRVVVSPPIDVE